MIVGPQWWRWVSAASAGTALGTVRHVRLSCLRAWPPCRRRRVRLSCLRARPPCRRRRVRRAARTTFGAVTGADASLETRLTREVERLQEDNERKEWMIKEKQKEIDETKARYRISRARKLEEQFQELCESLQSTVKVHDQIVETLGSGLKAKLEIMADQVEDLTEEVREKSEKFNVLKHAALGLLRDNDLSQIPVISGICRWSDAETSAAEAGVNDRSSRTVTIPRIVANPINAIIGPLLKNVGVCAPPVNVRGSAATSAGAPTADTPPATPGKGAPPAAPGGVMEAPGAEPFTPCHLYSRFRPESGVRQK